MLNKIRFAVSVAWPVLVAVFLIARAANAQTFNVPVTVTVTPSNVTVSVAGSTQTYPVPVAPAPAVCAAGVVYSNGTFCWPGDWSAPSVTLNYKDTTVNAAGDLKVTPTGPWGYWLPYAPNDGPPVSPGSTYLTPSLNTTPFTVLSLQIYPTNAAQTFSVLADVYEMNNGTMTGDISAGPRVDNMQQYCTAFKVNAWVTCSVPLAAFSAANRTNLYKILIQDQSGLTGDTFYLNNVQFK